MKTKFLKTLFSPNFVRAKQIAQSMRNYTLCFTFDSLIVLRSEISSGTCAKLRPVAASNNRDHPTRSISSSPFASTINCSPGSQALFEVTHQDHSIGITLLLLVRTTYMYFCSSRTSRSWWITQSTQHHRRGCNNIPPFYKEPHRSHVLCVKAELGTTSTSWSQQHFADVSLTL